jgi:hypothetical protein
MQNILCSPLVYEVITLPVTRTFSMFQELATVSLFNNTYPARAIII